MTPSEAALLASELGKFVEEYLPEHHEFLVALSDLRDVLSTLEEDKAPSFVGNTKTHEIRSVDYRDWRSWDVEWVDKDTLTDNDTRKEV